MRRSLFTGRSPRLLRAAAFAAALAPAMASAAEVNFDAQAPGTFLTTQLRFSHGVVFPQGLVVLALPDARSAPNLGESPYDGEFRRHPVNVSFLAGQATVSTAFRASANLGALWDVTLTAYDAGEAVVDTSTVRFTAGTTWRTLTVGTTTSNIRRVVLTGGLVGAPFETNFLFVDDITYTTVPPPPPPDTIPPTVTILQPPIGAVVTSAMVPVEVRARDFGTSALLTVAGTVTHVDTGTIVGRMDYCGSPVSGPCPSLELWETLPVELEPALEGAHRASVTACDDEGNCQTRDRVFEVDLPEPPPEVTVSAVEVNQGVQPLLFDIGRPGTSTNGIGSVRMVAGRDTALRFYPLSVDAPREDYAARLHVRILYRDGTVLERYAMPNAGVAEVDVVPDPGTYEARVTEYLRMRPDRGRTLNYVVPGPLLVNANVLEVTLDDPTPVTGWLRVGFLPEVRLAVKHLALYGPGVGPGTAPTIAEYLNALRYVEETYPITDLTVVPSAPARIADDAVCEVSGNDLSCAVWQFSFYDPPGLVPSSAYPTHLMKVGRVPYGSFPRVGIAYYGSAIAMAYGDMSYAHEIGHTAGRPHAGGFHDEAGGEMWPFPHGQVGAMDFGVVTDRVAPPGPTDLGQWSLTVVDPCPGAEPPMRRPVCAQPDGEATHDFMSYGRANADLGPLNLTSLGRQWVSNYTWNRLYDRLRSSATAVRTEGLRGLTGTAHVEALLVDGLVREHGPVQPLPVLRLHVPADRVADPAPGPYTLELFGENNTMLLSRSFDAGEVHDVGEERRFLLGQVVPYFSGLRRVVVRKGGATLMVRTGSPRAPEVKVIHPNGGEVLPSGTHVITWTVADGDGDRVLSRVEYSSDGGATWGTLGMVAGDEPSRLEIDVALLPPSANAKFRVTASDGFHTSADASDCPLAVGVEGPAAECGTPEVVTVGVDVKPGAPNGCVNPDSEGVIPAAVIGAADLDAAAVDPATLVLAGIRVRVRGSAPQCWIRDASGPLGRPDGVPDRVCHFDNAGGGWDDDDGVAVLTGALVDGTPIRGSERVCQVPSADDGP